METEREDLCPVSLEEIDLIVHRFLTLPLRVREVLDGLVALRSQLTPTKYLLTEFADLERREVLYSRRGEWEKIIKKLDLKNNRQLIELWQEKVKEYLKGLEELDANDPKRREEMKVLYLYTVVLLSALIDRLTELLNQLW